MLKVEESTEGRGYGTWGPWYLSLLCGFVTFKLQNQTKQVAHTLILAEPEALGVFKPASACVWSKGLPTLGFPFLPLCGL